LVATASLELGIDIGDVDLVCQLGSPRAISALLQRVGRSGHGIERVPKGRLFPLTRDDLVECTALLDAVRRGELDRIRGPVAPLDVLAQQIVAELAAAGEYSEADLYRAVTRAWPYHGLEPETFEAVVEMLAQGFTSRWGRRGAYLHRDRVNARLRARRGARLVAITNGGAIPDQFDYDVMLQPEDLRVGSVNEDFAFESMPGDVFQLGNTAYRILKVESSRVYVENARGAPPSIPFWVGEAPGRTDELSIAVSRLRVAVDARLAEGGAALARDYLIDAHGLSAGAADQLADYLGAARQALGALPTQAHLVLERFFDEIGDMHLVLHSPYGSRLNRAWGLALRKRFCRRFNFELQAAALEDSIVLSLGPTHSFALEEVAGYLRSASVRAVLTQALLDAPMFNVRWRWCATIALAVARSRSGRRRPAQFQRQDAEDLLSVVFPEQLACAENLSGAREIPQHPLVSQTVHDCLTEVMDVAGLERLLGKLERGTITLSCRDGAVPSPLAEEVLNARPYAFLDDAPQEERRTRTLRSGGLALADTAVSARPDPAAIARVCREVWPQPRDADELHDALVVFGFLTAAEAARGPMNEPVEQTRSDWRELFATLTGAARATAVAIPGGESLWVAAERLAELRSLHPELVQDPEIEAVAASEAASTAQTALVELIRSRLDGLGPVTAEQLAAPLGVSTQRVLAALLALEAEGFVIQGRFSAAATAPEWCERRLLARIQRYSVRRLRAEIEPVSPQTFMRFLLEWHGLADRAQGQEALARVLEQLEGFALPAAAWERDILPARIVDYAPQQLDQLLASGRFIWLRLMPPRSQGEGARRRPGAVSQIPITLIERSALPLWRALAALPDPAQLPGLSSAARQVLSVLERQGASFFTDLVEASGLLRTQVEVALGELIGWGLISSDTFTGLRALSTPAHKRPSFAPRGRRRRRAALGVSAAGRWVCLESRCMQSAESPARRSGPMTELASLEHIAWVLLQRYGVVFRKLLERESAIPPWRELLYVYHRLEARGEIRGGRFVQQFSGEQFALPRAVAALKAMRRSDGADTLAVVSAADPLNLLGIITPGRRLPALTGNRIIYRDGVPEALYCNGTIGFLREPMPAAQRLELQERLLVRHRPGAPRLARSDQNSIDPGHRQRAD
ncbi:MAG: ATP-dependent DNA helicase, partial [Nitrococcus sp.]|nr:ATP-dependent DNA helicase [Nitrococcus sp.]